MKKRILLCSLLLALAVLPVSARADVVVPGQKPPEPAPATAAFESLYGAQVVDFDTAYADALDGPVETALWLYPGAAEPETSLTVEDYPADALSPCYVDADGNFWGYTGYIYGHRFVWICLSDPGGGSLTPNQTVIGQVEAAAAQAEAAAVQQQILAAVLVAAVVVVTLLLIWVFWRRRKRGKQV